MKRLLAGAASVVAVIVLVPVWTARWVEEKRNEALEKASTQKQPVPDCPADDSFASYLHRWQPAVRRETLWQPLCRKPEPPLGRAALVFAEESRYRQCRDELSRYPVGRAVCWLDAPVRFLAEPEAKKSIARRAVAHSEGEIIWATTVPLAWDEQLEREHRAWIALGLLLVITTYSAYLSRVRWLRAGCLQRELGFAPTLPPAELERLLLCVLPPFNYPQEADDLRESYDELAANEGSAAANRWYRWQVRQSLIHYLGQWCARMFSKSAKRSMTSGG
ncbi:MAG: hypothetical protein JNL98_02785 [Bryobacterales bacterium]|nr:hypothetical protein [Bryobacterales bacterium]